MTAAPFPTVEVSDPRFEADGLRQVTVHSPALGHRADCTVWTPAGHDGPLPLVVLLHGVYGSHWAWTAKGGAHRTARRLIDEGEIPPVALACPSDGLFGHGSGYVTHPTQDFERWIIDEVPRAAALAAPVDPDSPFAIVGLSMGGYGAVRLGARHPDRVHASVGMSSICRWASMRSFVDLPDAPGFERLPAPEDPDLDALLTAASTRPRLLLTCGVDDPLFGENESLHATLDTAGIDHRYETSPGGHDWRYWERILPTALAFATSSP